MRIFSLKLNFEGLCARGRQRQRSKESGGNYGAAHVPQSSLIELMLSSGPARKRKAFVEAEVFLRLGYRQKIASIYVEGQDYLVRLWCYLELLLRRDMRHQS